VKQEDLIYQEIPDISESAMYRIIIPFSQLSLKNQYYQHYIYSCPSNNSPGTDSAVQFNSKDQSLFHFDAIGHQKKYLNLSKREKKMKIR